MTNGTIRGVTIVRLIEMTGKEKQPGTKCSRLSFMLIAGAIIMPVGYLLNEGEKFFLLLLMGRPYLYGIPSQLPAMGISPGIPKANTMSAKPTVLLLRR